MEKAPIVAWSDGACIALVLAMRASDRMAAVSFFGCNMDPSGTRDFVPDPIVDRCFSRHGKDYAALSATPDHFQASVEAVELIMKTEPTYAVQDLPNIQAPVANVQSEHGEFIRQEHAEYLLTHSRSGIHPPARREPFRTAATAGAIQSCDARLPWQVLCLRGLLDIIPFRANLMVMGIAISPRGVMPKYRVPTNRR